LAFGNLVAFAPGEDVGQGALAGAVRAHDGVHLAGGDLEVDAVENGLSRHRRVQVPDGQHVQSSSRIFKKLSSGPPPGPRHSGPNATAPRKKVSRRRLPG